MMDKLLGKWGGLGYLSLQASSNRSYDDNVTMDKVLLRVHPWEERGAEDDIYDV